MENMKKHAREWHLTISYLLDDTQAVAKDYGAVCTPDPFLFNANGKLVFHGRLNNAMSPTDQPSEDTMAEVITKLLNNEPLPIEPLPSQGCSIKWFK